jgi:hypothetical protein
MVVVVKGFDGVKTPYGFSTEGQDIVDYYQDLVDTGKIESFEVA